MTKAILLILGLAALAVACSSAPTPSTTTSAAPSNGAVDQMSAPAMAEAYVRAIYSGDESRAKALYLLYSPDAWKLERKAKLESVTVTPLPDEKVTDGSSADWHFYLVTTAVSMDGKRGKGQYKIGLMAMPQAGGALRVNRVAGEIKWD